MLRLVDDADGAAADLAREPVAGAGQERDGRSALRKPPQGSIAATGERLDDPRAEQGEPGGGFAALSSGDAELDEAIMSETALQLFPTDDPPGAKKAATRAQSTVVWSVTTTTASTVRSSSSDSSTLRRGRPRSGVCPSSAISGQCGSW